MKYSVLLTIAILLGIGALCSEVAAFEIEADFPGGHIVIERMDGDDVFLRPNAKGEDASVPYWCFRVRYAEGERLSFHFPAGAVGKYGPAVSVDGGVTWTWPVRTRHGAFSYSFAEDAGEVVFAAAPRYVEADLYRFIMNYSHYPSLWVGELGRSPGGRRIERFHLGKVPGQPEHRVLLTCRRRAGDTVSSFVLEGMIAAVLADTGDGRWFRDHTEIMVVPFLDRDGIEQSLFIDEEMVFQDDSVDVSRMGESVSAVEEVLRGMVPRWSDGRLRLMLDLGCVWPGDYETPADARVSVNSISRGGDDGALLDSFRLLLEQNSRGVIPYEAAPDNPAVSAEEPGVPADQEMPRSISGVPVAQIAVPIDGDDGVQVTPDTARALGADIVRALRIWLEREPGSQQR